MRRQLVALDVFVRHGGLSLGTPWCSQCNWGRGTQKRHHRGSQFRPRWPRGPRMYPRRVSRLVERMAVGEGEWRVLERITNQFCVPTSNLSLIRHLLDVLLGNKCYKRKQRSNSQPANHFKFTYYSLESYICLGLCLATLHNAGTSARGI